MKPNFSIAVIVKNEEKTLPRLLSSLEEFRNRGGEIAVLDTGSTDKTVQIAKKSGCNVKEIGTRFVYAVSKALVSRINNHLEKGEDEILVTGEKYFDFSSARNYVANITSNEWILSIDADEITKTLDIDKLQEAIKNTKATSIGYEYIFSHYENGTPELQYRLFKLYQKSKLQFEGLAHEYLVGIGDKDYVGPDILKIEHYQNPLRDRGTSTIKLLALNRHKYPDSGRASFYFGRELMWTNRPKSAIKELIRCLDLEGWEYEKAQARVYIGDCYKKLGNTEEQIKWYQASFNFNATRRESLMRLAWLYFNKKDPQRTACYASAALQIPWNTIYFNEEREYKADPHDLMYWALSKMGFMVGAKYHLDVCLNYEPYNERYLRDTRFFHEYPDNGISGWMRMPELTWLYETAKTMDNIAEIGSWKGKSTHALLSGCKGKVTAVDHFKGSPGEVGHKEAKSDAVYKAFLKNVGHFKNLIVNREDSIKASKKYLDRYFDMVFIDGSHQYKDVRKDIKAWLPKAKKLICGHDYSDVWPDVKKAVNDELGEENIKAVDSIWYMYL